MSSKVLLSGGNFQDAEGNVLADGYLVMALSQDAQANQNTQVVGGRNIIINLDAAGNVITVPGQYVWGNDVLTPTSTYYTVWGYNADGQLCWGPNPVIVTSGNTDFDVGTWVPPAINIGPDVTVTEQNIVIEVNGVPTASQNTLNLEAGSNMTITAQVGGGILFSSSGSGGGGGGGGINIVPYSTTPNFALSAGQTQVITLNGNVTSSTITNGANGTFYVFTIIQDSTGGHSFAWPSNFVNAGQISSSNGTAQPNTLATQMFVFIAQAASSFYAVTPLLYNQQIP